MVGSESVANTFELLIIDENGNNFGDSNWNANTADQRQVHLSNEAPEIKEAQNINAVPLEGL